MKNRDKDSINGGKRLLPVIFYPTLTFLDKQHTSPSAKHKKP